MQQLTSHDNRHNSLNDKEHNMKQHRPHLHYIHTGLNIHYFHMAVSIVFHLNKKFQSVYPSQFWAVELYE